MQQSNKEHEENNTKMEIEGNLLPIGDQKEENQGYNQDNIPGQDQDEDESSNESYEKDSFLVPDSYEEDFSSEDDGLNVGKEKRRKKKKKRKKAKKKTEGDLGQNNYE